MCCIIAFFVLPETKGKTLEQIQEYFEKTTNKSNKSYHADERREQSKCAAERDVTHLIKKVSEGIVDPAKGGLV